MEFVLILFGTIILYYGFYMELFAPVMGTKYFFGRPIHQRLHFVSFWAIFHIVVGILMVVGAVAGGIWLFIGLWTGLAIIFLIVANYLFDKGDKHRFISLFLFGSSCAVVLNILLTFAR